MKVLINKLILQINYLRKYLINTKLNSIININKYLN